MASCFGGFCCCAACRPRYRRLVDAIYPDDPTQGLVKANMEKLTYYAITHSDKLDRIGEYLSERLGRDIYKQRTGLVRVTSEAMDQLLASCHGSPSLNMFVDSFLKMVQKLLETQDAALEIMATDSFVNFANIEEETPGYHRRYDFFISKFSSMCHSNDINLTVRKKLRMAGLRGLRGVVRKTVGDDLQANIWDKQHMEKIVPSVLFNMHDEPQGHSVGGIGPSDLGDSVVRSRAGSTVDDATDGAEQIETPKSIADICLRELVGKASFGNMRSVLSPVLKHCDLHNLWTSTANFCVTFFRAIMYSIQAQYSYSVIQTLISHLDQHSNSKAEVRIGMASVLSEIVLIAGAGMGPSLLEIFNSLLRHLRGSVEYQLSDKCPSEDMENLYQETLINTMGDFANSLPDYQKVEIMMFIIGKVPSLRNDERLKRGDTFLQTVLVKTLLKVATKYKTGYLATALTNSFLNPLLKLALVGDSHVRLLTQQILHTLLDRHQNLAALQHLEFVDDVDTLQLTVAKCSRVDQMFIKKNGTIIMSTLLRSAVAGSENTTDNFDAILCTMALLCVEVGHDELLIELFRLAFAMQTHAIDRANQRLSLRNRCQILNLVAKYMNLSSQLMAIPSLIQHVQQVAKQRMQRAHPSLNLQKEAVDQADGGELGSVADLNLDDDMMLFDRQAVAEALSASGKDVARLSVPFSVKGLSTGTTGADVTDGRGSPSAHTDGVSLSGMDIISVDSSLGGNGGVTMADGRRGRRDTIFGIGPTLGAGRRTRTTTVDKDDGPLTVERLKEILAQPPDQSDTDAEMEQTMQIVTAYRTHRFDEMVEMNRQDVLPDPRERIRRLMLKSQQQRLDPNYEKPKTVFEIELPEMFVY